MVDRSRGDELVRRAEETAREVAVTCLGWRVRMLNRLVTAIYDDALRPLGLTGAQFSILCCLQLLPRKRPVDIGQVLKIDKSTLSRNIDRMRRNGWVTRSRGRTELALTQAGLTLIARALPHWRKAQAACEGLLGAQGSHEIRLLAQQVAGLKLDPAAPSG